MGSAESWYNSSKAKWTALDRTDFAYPFAEDVFVRRVIATDVRDFEAIMEYLPTTGPWADGELVIGNQVVGGAWQHMTCGYRPLMRGQESGPWEIWQACIHPASSTTDGFDTVEDGCTYKNELEFFWRRSELALPVGYTSSSGIEYGIESPNRDPQTGLWSFIVRKTTQYTTWTGIKTLSDEVLFKVEEQTFLGVREDNTLAPKVASGFGSLWTVGTSKVSSKWVSVQNTAISKNQNCTYNITQRRTTANNVTDAVKRVTADLFESRTSSTNRNQEAADTSTTGLINPGSSTAEIVTVENTKTDEGAVNVQKDSEKPAEKWSGSLTFSGDGKTITVTSFTNYTIYEVQLFADTLVPVSDVSVSFRPNRWGLVDGTITASVSNEAYVSRTAWSESVTEYERLASGEVLELTGTAAFGYNVSSGANTFYSSPAAYRQYSWFHDVGGNWYMYKKITGVTTKYP